MHNSYNSTMRVTLAHLDVYRRNGRSSGKRTPRGKNVCGYEGERFRRGMQVSRCHGNTRRERLWLPVTLPRGLGKKRRECATAMKKRGRLLQKENRPLDRVPIRHDAYLLARLSPSYRADGSVCWAYWKSDKKDGQELRCSNIHHRISRDIPWKDLTVAVISYLLIFYCWI